MYRPQIEHEWRLRFEEFVNSGQKDDQLVVELEAIEDVLEQIKREEWN